MGNQSSGFAGTNPQASFMGTCLAAPGRCSGIDIRKGCNGSGRCRHCLEGRPWTVRGGVFLSRAGSWSPYSLVRLAHLVSLHPTGCFLWCCSLQSGTGLGEYRRHRSHHWPGRNSFWLAIRAMALQSLAGNLLAYRPQYGLACFRAWRNCTGGLARQYAALSRDRHCGRCNILACPGAQAQGCELDKFSVPNPVIVNVSTSAIVWRPLWARSPYFERHC